MTCLLLTLINGWSVLSRHFCPVNKFILFGMNTLDVITTGAITGMFVPRWLPFMYMDRCLPVHFPNTEELIFRGSYCTPLCLTMEHDHGSRYCHISVTLEGRAIVSPVCTLYCYVVTNYEQRITYLTICSHFSLKQTGSNVYVTYRNICEKYKIFIPSPSNSCKISPSG